MVDDHPEEDGPVRLQDPHLVAKERRKHRSQMAADLLEEENRGMLPDITKAEVQYEVYLLTHSCNFLCLCLYVSAYC